MNGQDQALVVSGAQIEAKLTRVSAAVILRTTPLGGEEYLLAQRPPGKAYAGYWEFPGGKVEAGETYAQALTRELQEELGVCVTAMTPWVTRHFVYPHARVAIRFFRVTAWQGNLQPLEHTGLAWLDPTLMAGCSDLSQIPVSPVLPANTPILRALALPPVYAITHAGEIGVAAELARLHRAKPMLVQVREKTLPLTQRMVFAQEVVALVHGYGGQVVLNGSVEEALQLGADGVHLTAAALAACSERPLGLSLVMASCHNAEELRKASSLALDAVVLGSVQATQSHPGRPLLGWDGLAQLVEGYTLPVYALGGLLPADLSRAQSLGAQGIALMRGW